MRVAAAAQSGEVVASSLVRDLVAGSGLRFGEARAMRLDGVAEPLRLHCVEEETPAAPPAATSTPQRPELTSLSQREREVIALIAQGLSNAAIARRLQLSDHTVKRHVANILMKLDLPTRAAAAALVGRTR